MMLNVMLHRIMPDHDPDDYYFRRGTAISRCKFLKLLDYIEEKDLITLSAVTPMSVPVSIPEYKSICLTFDDGYRDNAWAFDQLLSRNMSAVLFPVRDYVQSSFSVIDDFAVHVNSGRISTELLERPELRSLLRRLAPERYRRLRSKWLGIEDDTCPDNLFLKEADITHYASHGIGVGIHGTSHRIWSVLGRQALRTELTGSADWIHGLTGKKPESVCFPHGKEPKPWLLQEIISGYDCIGVDREYNNQSVIRRIWMQEATNIGTLLDGRMA